MKKVLVTGISGYIGNHCAVELLKSGFSVRGSLRDLSKSKITTESIKKETNPGDNLEFCQLDLLKDEGWDKAMEGCQYVLHVASPYINYEPKDENLYIKPAIEGTNRALKSAKKAGIKTLKGICSGDSICSILAISANMEMSFSLVCKIIKSTIGVFTSSKAC